MRARHLDISYLETVLAVAKYRSFSRAAEEIPCSQASVSRQVSDVEKALGYDLFNRTTKRGIINVTEEGRLAIPQIERIVKEYSDLFRVPKEVKQPTYRLGLSAGLFNFKAKYNIVSHVFKKYPDINLVLTDVDRTAWLNTLTDNQIDGLLMHVLVEKGSDQPTAQLSQQNGLNYTYLRKQSPYVAMPKDHRLAGREILHYEDLKDETFLFNRNISIAKDSRDLLVGGFLRCCELAGFEPHIVSQNKMGADFANVRDTSIIENGWVYPTYQCGAWCRNDGIVFVPLDDPLFHAEYYFVTLERKTLPLDDMICRCMKELFSEEA